MLNNYVYNLFLRKFFSFKGRSNRKEYIARSLVEIFSFFLMLYTVYNSSETDSVYYDIYLIGLFLFCCLMYFQSIPLNARRLHDLNASGWWQLIILIPFGQWLFIFLAVKKGTPGSNKYGEPPID